MSFIRNPTFAWLVTVIVIFAAVAFGVRDARHYSNQTRSDVATATQTVLNQTCVNGDKLRESIRSVLTLQKNLLVEQEKRGHIDSADAAAQNALFDKDLMNIKIINCAELTAPLHASTK